MHPIWFQIYGDLIVFNKDKIHELYPGAEDMMQEAMLIWKLPAGKENMMSEVCENGQYFAEEKLDGAWYQFTKGINGEKYLFGRTVSKVTGLMTEKGGNVPHILSAFDCLPNGTALIGEIYYPGCTAKDTVTIMGCLPLEAIKRQEYTTGRGPIHYYVHDIIFYDGVNLMGTGAWDRYRILKAIWEKHDLQKFDYLRLAEVVERDIEDEVSRILKSGGEGMVLKKRDAIYYPGKRPAWTAIKFKQMDDIDLVCTRTIPATRNYTGKELETWPYWEKDIGTGEKYIATSCMCDCEDWDPVTKPYALGWHTAVGIGLYNDAGELIEIGTVSSGLTDEIKEDMGKTPENYIGKVLSVHCMSKDKKSYTLRHPVFTEWREDKNKKECTFKDVFS